MGKPPQLDLGEITFGRVVSSDSSGGGDHLQLIFVETNTIAFGTKSHWVELSQVTARGVTFNLSL